jgi:hypothetical protein
MMTPWSEADRAKLIQMRDAGISFAVIAKKLGRTEVSCESQWRNIRKTRHLAAEEAHE